MATHEAVLAADEASPGHGIDDTPDGIADAGLPDSSSETGEVVDEEEWYSVIWVPPGSLIIGPNVRQENAVPDKDDVRDIKKRGVRAPILAYRDIAGQLVVTMGQMRTLSAIEAEVKEVPVWVQPPPSADEKAATIDRIIDQLGENDHRRAMTRGDVYQAHQQLRLLGLSATAIARRRSRSKRDVEDSLRVGDSELAAKAADKYALTLEQAAVIAEFEGHGDLQTARELILTAVEKPTNFRVLAQRKRDDHAEAQRLKAAEAALVEQLTTAGITIFDDSLSDWSSDARSLDRLRATPAEERGAELTVDDHATCPGHGAWIYGDSDGGDGSGVVAVYGCADFRAHGHALLHAPAGQADHAPITTASVAEDDGVSIAAAAELESKKARIQRRWVIENNKNWDAAVKVRHEWLANFARRSSAPKTARVWLARQKLAGSHELRKAMERRHGLAHRLLKLPEPRYGQTSDLVDRIANASEAKATVWDLYLTLAAMEEGLQRDAWRRAQGSDATYMSMLIELGYEPHDVERKVITPEAIEDVLAEQLPGYTLDPNHDLDLAEDVVADDTDGVGLAAEHDGLVVDLNDFTDEPARTESAGEVAEGPGLELDDGAVAA